MNTDNLGVKEFIVGFLSFAMWLSVSLFAIAGFAINIWVGSAFVGTVVLTHIIAAVIAKIYPQAMVEEEPKPKPAPKRPKPEEPKEEEPKEEEPAPEDPYMEGIPEEYFTQVTKAAKDLFADYKNAIKLPNIDELIDTLGVKFVWDGQPLTEVKDKVCLLFRMDVARCYTGLGHTIDLNNKEGLGLFFFIALTQGCAQKKSYADLPAVKATYQADAESILKGINACMAQTPAPSEVFLMSRLLAASDMSLHRKFLVDIYRFASITAKADNTITNEEAEWLSNIMKLQENEKQKADSPAQILDELIGLEAIKKEVNTLSNFIKIQQARAAKGLKTSPVSYHCVFTGNPGTGKTTVARILSRIYKDLGVVKKGQLIETDRAGLVGQYIGETAIKTNKIIDKALDGVLFIDEAYSLIGGGERDYGKEAIATLLKRMEDDRDRLIVILAGYTENMKDFVTANPGIQSRFNRYLEFPDYSAEELLQIFEANMKTYEYQYGEGVKEALQQYFSDELARKDANFGNGRLVRNVFEKTLERQANRLAPEVNLTTEKLSRIELEDLPIK